MTTEGKKKAKTAGAVTLTSAMVFSAIFWGGKTDANVKTLEREAKISRGIYMRIDRRLSRMEGAMGLKQGPSLTDDESEK